ncbi:hypothetical protein [Nocardia cyriacigeorgica]|uniref:hypothetical protein n=1 Tax=Nocardia cyriacigeorgica TaxID=135487 RepID=UPI001893E965|nr:hypothetical protein [Nocardia cyriacigeorgica]MBF6437882.1 hypothetical protein [Nocardia cyriacigeorgica]
MSGFYNHYDDPDEFWDEEPPVPQPTVERSPLTPPPTITEVPPSPSRSVGHVTSSAGGYQGEVAKSGNSVLNPHQKTSLVEVELQLDRLPTGIKLARSWKSAFDPAQYSRSIMDAYHHAVFEKARQLAEWGVVPPATAPTLREAAPLLLRSRTIEEYEQLHNHLFLPEEYTVYGPGYNEYNKPGIVVTGTRSKLISVTIDPAWAMATDSDYIALDIVDCCNQIRAKKPTLARDMYLDQESDQDLTARISRHRYTLLTNA